MIVPGSLADLMIILNALRPEDEAEYRATLGDLSRGQAATHILMARPFCWVARDGDAPVAFIAAHKKLDHRYGISLAATQAFPNVVGGLTRWIGREMFPTLWRAGCRRAEAVMVDGHPTAGRWMQRLGAVHEAEMPLAGVNAETLHLYAWRATDADLVGVDPGEITAAAFFQTARKVSDTAIQ